ncbi:MAG: ABC transporter, partial [Nocardioides sp.]|nr:ABC transporter [Nocardioides sp.]
ERSTRWRAGRATGWPLVSWVGRFRPDPLKKLELDLGTDSKALRGQGGSAPQATAVQRATIDAEVRSLADDVSEGLAPPFAESVRRASTARLPEVGDRLDDALRSVDLDAERLPVWAGAVRVLQWLLVLTALVGGAWSIAALASGGLGDLPRVAGVALPLVLLGGGVLLGVLLGLVCRGLVSATARSRASAADTRLRAAVSEVAAELVVAPVQAELTAYTALRTGLDRALA